MSFTPTVEQQACLDFVKTESRNLLIRAYAGAAKTSTLELIANADRGTPTLCLAFNVRIVKEMKERLPGNCEVKTLNSLGHGVWMKAIGKRLVIEHDKVYRLTKTFIEKVQDPETKSALYEYMSDLIRAVKFGKTSGYVPTGKFPLAKPLVQDEDFFAMLDEDPGELVEHAIREITIASITESLQGTCDYDDQILMPTVFHGAFPQAYKKILVDEVQDFSALNHAMLSKLMRGAQKRLIAVGDENQSIYGFRGAHENSMELLRETFDMKILPLTVTFRCPIAVVEEARWRTPSMKYPEWAKPGQVRTLQKWDETTLEEDAVILCRNNAPVFACAIKLLRNGVYPEVVGADIGKALVKLMKKLCPPDTPREEAETVINNWVASKSLTSRDMGKIHDQAECIRVFLEQGATMGDAIAYAEHIMAVSGQIKLMTIHKAKGLEWDNIYILDRDLIRLEHTQEKNLLYVAQTRARATLTYVNLKDFQE